MRSRVESRESRAEAATHKREACKSSCPAEVDSGSVLEYGDYERCVTQADTVGPEKERKIPEELGTKDVLEQVDTRLGNVEGDIRGLRKEMNTPFDRVYQEMAGLRGEMAAMFRGVAQRFMWLYGLLVALLIGVAGLWLK